MTQQAIDLVQAELKPPSHDQPSNQLSDGRTIQPQLLGVQAVQQPPTLQRSLSYSWVDLGAAVEVTVPLTRQAQGSTVQTQDVSCSFTENSFRLVVQEQLDAPSSTSSRSNQHSSSGNSSCPSDGFSFTALGDHHTTSSSSSAGGTGNGSCTGTRDMPEPTSSRLVIQHHLSIHPLYGDIVPADCSWTLRCGHVQLHCADHSATTMQPAEHSDSANAQLLNASKQQLQHQHQQHSHTKVTAVSMDKIAGGTPTGRGGDFSIRSHRSTRRGNQLIIQLMKQEPDLVWLELRGTVVVQPRYVCCFTAAVCIVKQKL